MAFGPIYPPAMRRAASHADSLSTVLATLEVPSARVVARAWLLGRRQEIDCYVRQLACDFRYGRLGEEAAAAALEAYLAALHRGLAHHFELRAPRCCGASTRATVVVAEPSDVATTVIDRAPPRRPRHVVIPTFEEVLADDLLAGFANRRLG